MGIFETIYLIMMHSLHGFKQYSLMYEIQSRSRTLYMFNASSSVQVSFRCAWSSFVTNSISSILSTMRCSVASLLVTVRSSVSSLILSHSLDYKLIFKRLYIKRVQISILYPMILSAIFCWCSAFLYFTSLFLFHSCFVKTSLFDGQ